MLIDLNAERSARAARREGGGGPLKVPFGDTIYELPAELPASIIDRFLDPEVELAQLLVSAARALRTSRSEQVEDVIADVLSAQPELPFGIARAVYGAIEDLFGPDQWTQFQVQRPSVPDMVALIRGLVTAYGATLGEASSSSEPAVSGGATSSAISNASTASTPEVSGPLQDIRFTSASAG